MSITFHQYLQKTTESDFEAFFTLFLLGLSYIQG